MRGTLYLILICLLGCLPIGCGDGTRTPAAPDTGDAIQITMTELTDLTPAEEAWIASHMAACWNAYESFKENNEMEKAVSQVGVPGSVDVDLSGKPTSWLTGGDFVLQTDGDDFLGSASDRFDWYIEAPAYTVNNAVSVYEITHPNTELFEGATISLPIHPGDTGWTGVTKAWIFTIYDNVDPWSGQTVLARSDVQEITITGGNRVVGIDPALLIGDGRGGDYDPIVVPVIPPKPEP